MDFNHVISTAQFTDWNILHTLFKRTATLKDQGVQFLPSLWRKTCFVLFYEPSTRTRFSFETAVNRLGGHVVSSESAGQFSSAIKGERLEDTIQVLAGYDPFAIIIRHPHSGAASRAVNALPKNSQTKIINAGDGDGEHPTQALLDAFTIWNELGTLDDLEIALLGDLKYGRTIHSLIQLLACFKNVKLHLVSPPNLTLPPIFLDALHRQNIQYREHDSIQNLPDTIDVIYTTRIQLERFNEVSNVEMPKVSVDRYRISSEILEKFHKKTLIMHPLPRTSEIDLDVDADPRAAYFRQATNGLWVRMALLDLMSGKDMANGIRSTSMSL